MTVAIGMVAENGLVIAADTQETIQGYWKVHSGKIRAVAVTRGRTPSSERPLRGAMLTSAAGHPVFCDGLMAKLLDTLKPSLESGGDDVQARCATVVKDFYDAHVVPLQTSNPPPDVEALVAVDAGYTRLLAIAAKGVLVPNEHFVTVGIGGLHAHSLLNQLWHWRGLTPVTMAVIAAYVIFDVKERVDGCGKWTEIGILSHGRFHFVSRDEILALEDTFRTYLGEIQPGIFRFMANAATDTPTMGELSRQLRAARRDILTIVRRIHERVQRGGGDDDD